MLRLPHFSYESPTSIGEAAAMLSGYGGDAVVVSGGTDLFPNMKQRLFAPKVLVSLSRIAEMNGIRYDAAGWLEIGASTTLHAIATHADIIRNYRALAVAASLISTPELRRMGTIGGNVCLDTRCYYYNQDPDWRDALGHCLKKDGDVCRVAPGSARCLAINASDLVPVLQAFDARVQIASAAGYRTATIGELYTNDGRRATTLKSGELITKIALPPSLPYTRSAYRKLRLRESFDFPLAGVAAVVNLDEMGICRDARIVAGALGPQPIVCADARAALLETDLSDAALSAAADCVYAAGKPMENAATTPLYRKRMLRVYVFRTLQELQLSQGRI